MKHLKYAPLLICILLSYSLPAQAYPDFIGYGYSSCITCHNNGLGGGSLSDYGRALFATEISARDIYPDKMEEEEIGAKSGFLGSTQLPWWVRPGAKYRGLWLKRALGAETSPEMWINMQLDLNLNFYLDKKQDIAIITTPSYISKEGGGYYSKTDTIFMKEYYLRYKVSKNWWAYLGQMDIAYGIRQIDHTMVSRAPIGLGMYSQSMGAIVHVTYPEWDLALNAFVGNAAQEDELKQKGFSLTGEYQIVEKFKIGASLLNSESDQLKYNLMAITTRMGLSKGTSVMAEAGLKEITTVSTGDKKLGSYAYVQSLVNIRRGYNFLSVIENSKSDIQNSSTEILKWSFGALLFPLPRSEVRMMLTNGKAFDDSTANEDVWALQGQIHVSY
ncbi:hypothetical protein D3C87_1148130 [compost metagenome]